MKHHRGLHQEAGLRLDADGGDGRLRRGRRDAHRHQPVPGRRLPDHHRQRRPGRAPRPRSIENDVVEPLEEALVQVEGVAVDHLDLAPGQRQRSPSSSTSSRDVDLALQDVQTKVAQAQRRLPRDIDPPVVSKTNPEDQPIMWIGLSGPFSPQVLADYARYQVKEKLQTVPGVGEITMGGYLERNVRIWIDADQLDEQRPHRRRRHRARCSASTSSCPPAASRPRAARSTCACSARRSTSTTLRRIVVARASAARRSTSSDVALVEDGFEDVRRRRARQRRAGAGPGHPQAARRQRGRGRAGRAQAALDEIQQDAARGHGARHQLRLDAVHRGVGARDRVRAAARGAPHRARLLAVPRLALEHAQRGAGDPDVAARHGRGHLLPRLHAQHVHAARAGARGRHRRRRRDHGAGEHLPPRRDGQGPRARGARGHAGDHLRRAGRDAGGRSRSSCRSSS